MKYTICRKDEFVCNPDNTRMLFDSIEGAEKFKSRYVDQLKDSLILGYMDESKMIVVNKWKAWRLFDSGVSIYTKIWGVNWQLCTKEKWSFDEFTCGHFTFYIEDV